MKQAVPNYKPTDDELKEFISHYEGRLPDPTHYPQCFLYYWRMWLFKKGKL